MKRTSFLLLLAAGLLILSGCGSDALAPNDPVPDLSELESANQAGLVGYAVSAVGPLAVTFDQKSQVYTFPQGGLVEGSVNLDFRTGGAQGTSAVPSAADYVHMSTVGDNGLTVESPLGGLIYLSADIMATIARGTIDSATILAGSGGTLDAGAYSATFTISNLAVYESGYPSGGPIMFDNGYHTLALNFNGTHLAEISLNGTVIGHYDLDSLAMSAPRPID